MIEIKNLTKIYNRNKIVDNLSLSVKTGEVFGFLGPNGAGKTTTMKMLVGLLAPNDGDILIDNNDPKDIATRENIGYMPEEPYFYSHLTGLEFLIFCGQLFTISQPKNRGYFTKILSCVGLFEARNKMLKIYSKGMKQRLGLAQALINDPKYLFLDEPLDGLDPIGRREIKQIILGLKKRKKTIFINSHILSDIQETCDQIGVINRGKLVYTGTVAKFIGKKTLEEKFVEIIERDNHK